MYALVRSLLAGEKTFLQVSSGDVYLFSERGVALLQDVSTCRVDPGDLVLVDSGHGPEGPNPRFRDSAGFIVQVTSPLKTRYQEWLKQKDGGVFVMQAWKWNEIFIGG